MRLASLRHLVGLVTVLGVLSGCGRSNAPGGGETRAKATAAAAITVPKDRLSAQGLRIYLAVRGKALQRLEESLERAERNAGRDALEQIKELAAVERESAEALGFDWGVYASLRERVGSLITAQRQREDRRLLVAELERTEQELQVQLAQARDVASRQFLQAQLSAVGSQLERLRRDEQLGPEDANEIAILESGRAEIAVLQGRFEKFQHRMQELLSKAGGQLTGKSPERKRPQ